jgi:hypothetical protein
VKRMRPRFAEAGTASPEGAGREAELRWRAVQQSLTDGLLFGVSPCSRLEFELRKQHVCSYCDSDRDSSARSSHQMILSGRGRSCGSVVFLFWTNVTLPGHPVVTRIPSECCKTHHLQNLEHRDPFVQLCPHPCLGLLGGLLPSSLYSQPWGAKRP